MAHRMGKIHKGIPKHRKPPKVIWALVFHGLASTNLTCDMRCAFQTKKGAKRTLARSTWPEQMEIVKYVRAK
jgi:hypothetical protein